MKEPTPYPLCWPPGVKRTTGRSSDMFKVGLDQARKDLLAEVGRFGGREIVISSDMLAFSSAAPKDPGIAVWFKWKGVWRCVACDTYARFVANVRAVGLTVEALRTMERYGTQMLDQLMEGVNAERALPEPEPHGRAWWLVLRIAESASIVQIDTAYRKLAKERHPDSGGTDALMAELNWAKEQGYKAREQE